MKSGTPVVHFVRHSCVPILMNPPPPPPTNPTPPLCKLLYPTISQWDRRLAVDRQCWCLQGPSRLIPEKRLLFVHRAHPQPCPLCYQRAKRRYGQDIDVIHAGEKHTHLLPPGFSLNAHASYSSAVSFAVDATNSLFSVMVNMSMT